MTIDPELRQMLKDASASRTTRSWIVRAWHAAFERLNVIYEFRRNQRAGRPRKENDMLPFFDDLRHALRRLIAQPGSALTCVAMLAFAIGVTSAMFAVADHMLFRPAPFKDPSRLKRIFDGKDITNSSVYLSQDFARHLRGATVFSDVAIVGQAPVIVESSSGLRSIGAQWVSPNIFSMLGVQPIAGRTFTEAEGRRAATDLGVISERMWRRDFGGDPAIIGRTISASGQQVTVIGVLPLAFRFPSDTTELWRPYSLDAAPNPMASRNMTIYVRLAPGVPESDAARVGGEATRAVAADPANHGIIFRGAADGYMDDYTRNAVLTLMAGVSLVFIVLCANVANLILSRTVSRRQEFGVCTALGASRRRLITEVVLENSLIGVIAAIAGLLFAWGLVAFTVSQLPDSFTWRTLNPIALDFRAVAATASLGVIATVLAGLPPAWIGTKVDAIESIRSESRSASESRPSRLWARALLVGEVALASTLLVAAGVLVLTFVQLSRADSGMDTTNVVTAQINLPSFIFKDRDSRATVTAQLQDQLHAMPGVSAVTLSVGAPPTGGGFHTGGMIADGQPKKRDRMMVFDTDVSPEFFQVYGIRLLEGRAFTAGEPATNAIVSANLAAFLFPGQSALGHAFSFTGEKAQLTIVGVAHEVRSTLTDPREDSPEMYRPLGSAGAGYFSLGLRCDGRCPLEPELRARLLSVNAQAMVTKIRTVDDAYMAQFQGPRASAQLALGFSAIALASAAAGLFSILTYAVSRRRREFGIRIAMGANPRAIRTLILRDGLLTASAGLALGATLSVLMAKAVAALSFGVSLASPSVWAGVIALVVTTTILAAWRPAANAMRSDPIALLRDN